MVMTVAESHSFRHRMLGHHYANRKLTARKLSAEGVSLGYYRTKS